MGNTAVCALFVVDVWRSHRTVVFIDLGPNIMSFWWGFQNGKLWFQAVCLSCGKKWLSGYVSGYTHSVEMPNQLVYLKSWPLTVNITLLMLLHLHLSSSRTCTTCWILESFYLGKWGQKGRYGSILHLLVVPYTNWTDLGNQSLVLVQFSCPEIKPKFACHLRRQEDARPHLMVETVFNPGYMVRVEVWSMVFLCRNYRSKWFWSHILTVAKCSKVLYSLWLCFSCPVG